MELTGFKKIISCFAQQECPDAVSYGKWLATSVAAATGRSCEGGTGNFK